MIREIHITPPVATYLQVTAISDLRRINFIFGANGTGKTTISRIIARSMMPESCAITWDGGRELQCMVYNRDFIDQNFNQEGPLQGVFTLGANQVSAERQIASLQPEIQKTQAKIERLKVQLFGDSDELGKHKELGQLEPVLREKCWQQKQAYDDIFQVAFSGVRNSAEKFKTKMLSENATNSADLVSFEDLKERARTVFSTDIESYAPINMINAEELFVIEDNPLFQKVILGNQDVDIAALIDRLGNSDWVKAGVQYLEQQPNVCPFCQQNTDDKLAEQLVAFFDEAYERDLNALKQLQTSYARASEYLLAKISSITELQTSFINNQLFNAEAQVLAEKLKGNQDAINRKIAEPSLRIELESINTLIEALQSYITEANESISSHNQTVANITFEKSTLTSQVWKFLLNELTVDLEHYEHESRRLNTAIQEMSTKLSAKEADLEILNGQLRELERQTTSIQPTKSAINELLQKFGFTSFSIGESEDGSHYRIIRSNGNDASRSLSEGEKTFITFLYFYQLIKGAQSPTGINMERVIVFDDPISSLDSDILYIVSSLIKGVMEEVRDCDSLIKQVFILTHNVYFHKEISFNSRRPSSGTLNEESFWQVKKLQHGSVVERCDSNPIRSAYELLWEDVRTVNLSSVSLQNTLRRILENYFTMWGGMSKDDICGLFEGREKLICQSLFSWINDGSHSIHDDLYINHGEQTNEAYLKVFKDIFVKSAQIGHYNMMTGGA